MRPIAAPILGALLACGAAVAQSPPGGEKEDRFPGPPVARAVRAETPPAIDGEVLTDPAWSRAAAATGFRQTTPDEGHPASERTEVFILYSADTLYLGVVCHDRTPERIIVSDSRRDASLAETDSFQVVFDTFRDRRRGFLFGTNPAGIEVDGQVSREGSSFGSGDALNLNWDGAWEVEAKVGDFGWSAELAIPLRTLRYPGGGSQTWGVNFQRNIRRRNEQAYWSPLPRQYDLLRLSLAGSLEGLEVPAQRNLQLIPYLLADARRPGRPGADQETGQEAGGDLKWSITPGLTLDATFNTDFAQVEADEQQINLDRFNLFFPEKRPFFLENAGLFSVGIPEELELFFSRRIGIGPGGEAIPIEGGLRLSGRPAPLWNLGLLWMRAEEVEGVAPRNDFAVARVHRDFHNRSSLGAIAVLRRGGGELGPEEKRNRTYGLDGRWAIGANAEISGFMARTDTPGLEGDDYAFRIGGRYDSEDWLFSANYSEVAEAFNPEVGFYSRRGFRRPDFLVLYRLRPERLGGLHELRPHVSYRGFWNFDGFQETGFLHIDNHWEWKSGLELHTGINFTRQGVTEPFEIFPAVIVPAGTYDHREAQIVFFTNRGAPVGFELRANVGGFFGGDRVALTPLLRFRLGEAFNAELRWARNEIDLPAGSFDTNLGRLRVAYSLTTRISLQGLIQYNDRDDLWSGNVRFAWLRSANTGLFVVYNEVREVGSAGAGVPDRSLILKYSRLIDLLR